MNIHRQKGGVCLNEMRRPFSIFIMTENNILVSSIVECSRTGQRSYVKWNQKWERNISGIAIGNLIGPNQLISTFP